MDAMFFRFQEAEKVHGSLTRFWIDKKNKKAKNPAEFFTLRGGLEMGTEALVRELRSCDLRLSAPVSACAQGSGWKILLEHGETLQADMLCLAMNAGAASGLLARAAPDISRELSSIRHDSIMVVNIVYRCEDVPKQGLSFGFLVPAAGERCPFSSLKWLGKTEDGKNLLLRAFISRALMPGIFEEDDKIIKKNILTFLRECFGVEAAPRFISVEHYPQALPQYEMGHLERVVRIEKMTRQTPGLYLAGNGFRGFGITDCVHYAKSMVQSMELSDWQPRVE
jgi:oxygen-dependent protoporphyrinogen oxidase